MFAYEKNIGVRLKEFRKSMGMKLVSFSKLIGISHSSLSNIENNKSKPSSETFDSLCRNTNINIYWLLTGEGQMLRGPDIVLKDEMLNIGTYEGGPIGEHTQDAGLNLATQTPEQAKKRASLYNVKNPEALDLLVMTHEIIESNTGYAASLAANIRSFHQAMTTEDILNAITQDVGTMKGVMGDLVETCKEIKERLKKSDSSIRQEDQPGEKDQLIKKRAI